MSLVVKSPEGSLPPALVKEINLHLPSLQMKNDGHNSKASGAAELHAAATRETERKEGHH